MTPTPPSTSGTSSSPRLRRTLAAALVIAAAAALLAAVPADARASSGTRSAAPAAPTGAPLPDPGAAGPVAYDELAYDLGDQAFRPSGFPARVEVRAKVYAPQVIVDRAPIVILQHGRHATCATASAQALSWPCPPTLPEIPSYRGYDALGRNLASHGMVVVSIGANGINANDGFLDDGGAAARAQLILEHLRLWRAWDASAAGSPFGDRFVGHVDLDRVGLMGHSRGGEGVAAAVKLNQRSTDRFGIVAALALAPVDFARRVVGGVELGVILPYCDGDVSDLQGASYYDDSRYATPGDRSSKMTALLYGANHNFFNTVWTTGPGSFDDAGGFPGQDATATDPCRPGGVGRLTASQQEQAGAALMAGFLRRSLQPEPNLQPFVTGTAPYPASTGPARWSIAYHAPDRLDIAPWATPDTARRTSGGQVIGGSGLLSGLTCTFSDNGGGQPDGVALTVPGCPRQDFSAVVNDTGVLDAGWVRTGPSVRLPLAPSGTDVSGFDGLRMRVAVPSDSRNTTRAKQDFTVVLEDADGSEASVAASKGTNGLQRINRGNVQHAVLNGVRLPLSSFSGVDLTRIRAVELRFDRTGAGRLAIADLAFTMEGTGSAAASTVGAVPVTPSQAPCRAGSANRWACAVGQLAWGRDPVPPEVASVARGYATATGRRQAISRALSGPTAAALHRSQFLQAYTEGEIDPGAGDGMLSPNARRYWEQGLVELAAMYAFNSPNLMTPDDVVEAAYESILGRPVDPAGRAYWSPRVRSGGTRAMATSLVASAGYRGRIVDERYRQILGRAADPGGRSYWVGKLASPGGEQALVASLLATESFRAFAVH